ncbi:MAG: Ig-like domain-containing protein [Candidatus Limnocylindrales bacterium]
MPEYATSVCPYCSAALVPLPKANEQCPACGQPIHVRSGPDGYTYLLQERDLPLREPVWAEHRQESSDASSRIVHLVPGWSLVLVVLATVVQLGVLLGVAVPVGKTVLSGTLLSAATDLPSATETTPAGHSFAPSSGPVVTPLPVAEGVASGSVPTSRPTPTPTPTPTPKPTPRPTPDTQHPTITARTPGRNAVNILGNSTIRIVFSEPVRNVSDATIQLTNVRGGWLVHGKVRYDAAKRTATLTPDRRMYPNTEYRVTILPGVIDRAGNRLAPTSWSFRVGSR